MNPHPSSATPAPRREPPHVLADDVMARGNIALIRHCSEILKCFDDEALCAVAHRVYCGLLLIAEGRSASLATSSELIELTTGLEHRDIGLGLFRLAHANLIRVALNPREFFRLESFIEVTFIGLGPIEDL